jgi:hypothetical protein
MELEYDNEHDDWRALREDGTPCVIIWWSGDADMTVPHWFWVADGVQWKEPCHTRGEAWQTALTAIAVYRLTGQS